MKTVLLVLGGVVVGYGLATYMKKKKKCGCEEKAPPAETTAQPSTTTVAQTAASTGAAMNADGFNKALI